MIAYPVLFFLSYIAEFSVIIKSNHSAEVIQVGQQHSQMFIHSQFMTGRLSQIACYAASLIQASKKQDDLLEIREKISSLSNWGDFWGFALRKCVVANCAA